MNDRGVTWPDAPAGGPHHFGGVPGLYAPGVVVPLSVLEIDEATMQALIDEKHLPLEVVDLEPAPGESAPKKTRAKPSPEPEGVSDNG